MRQYVEVQLATAKPLTLHQIAQLNTNRTKFTNELTSKEKQKVNLTSVDRVGRKSIYAILTKKNKDYVEPDTSLAATQIIEDESNPPSVPSKLILEMVQVWDDELDKFGSPYTLDRMIGEIPVLVEKE